MKSSFYNRSAYRWISSPVPDCFLRFDDHVDRSFADVEAAMRSTHLALVENLCRRMADVEFYAAQVAAAANVGDMYAAGVLVSTYLVGYFSATKGVLDAAAIAIAGVYGLALNGAPLADKQMDFGKGEFWRALSQGEPAVARRYERFHRERNAAIQDLLAWRDAAVHRDAPLAMVVGAGAPDTTDFAPEGVRVFLPIGIDMPTFMAGGRKAMAQRVPPSHFHERWRPILIELCQLVCEDVAKALPSGAASP